MDLLEIDDLRQRLRFLEKRISNLEITLMKMKLGGEDDHFYYKDSYDSLLNNKAERKSILDRLYQVIYQ